MFQSDSYRQGPGPSNLDFKCQPRYSLVTKTTSPPCLRRSTSDTCRVAEEERLKGWGSFKQSTNRIQMSLINRMTSRPCVLKSISYTQRNDGIQEIKFTIDRGFFRVSKTKKFKLPLIRVFLPHTELVATSSNFILNIQNLICEWC